MIKGGFMKLKEVKKITGEIEVLTGLHIGAGNDVIEIGGMDNPIIKNPLNGEPDIPGSSLKGKMRALLELLSGRAVVTNGEPCNCGTCEICKVFGAGAVRQENEQNALQRSPTRLIIRDCFLTDEGRK